MVSRKRRYGPPALPEWLCPKRHPYLARREIRGHPGGLESPAKSAEPTACASLPQCRTTQYSSCSCPPTTPTPFLPSTFTPDPPFPLVYAGTAATPAPFLLACSDGRPGWFCSDTTADGCRTPVTEWRDQIWTDTNVEVEQGDWT